MGSTGLASCFLESSDFIQSPFKSSCFRMEAGYNQSYLLPSPHPPPRHLAPGISGSRVIFGNNFLTNVLNLKEE